MGPFTFKPQARDTEPLWEDLQQACARLRRPPHLPLVDRDFWHTQRLDCEQGFALAHNCARVQRELHMLTVCSHAAPMQIQVTLKVTLFTFLQHHSGILMLAT